MRDGWIRRRVIWYLKGTRLLSGGLNGAENAQDAANAAKAVSHSIPKANVAGFTDGGQPSAKPFH